MTSCRLLAVALVWVLAAGRAWGAAPPTPAAPLLPDTAALTLPQAEARFLDHNLALLAQKYAISAAQAQIVQARVWDNPTVYVEQNAWTPRTERYFDTGPTGNTALQVTQLFALAGRRKLAGRVAEQAALAQQFSLQDLLRTLRYQLRSTFYDLYFGQRSLAVYDREIGVIGRTVALYQEQVDKGNKALKEVIRLRAFLFQLQNERQDVWRQTVQQQADLAVLLNDQPARIYRPLADPAALGRLGLSAAPTPDALADSAEAHRADVLAQRAAVGQQAQNVRLQHALAAPDLALGYEYDRSGNFIPNYNAVSVGVAVPIFNRNCGNIRTAQAQLAAAQTTLTQQQTQARTDVAAAYAQAAETDRLYQSAGPRSGEFDKLMADIESSYARRSLSLLEFLDLYESYTQDQVQRNQLGANRLRAFESLNLAVGRLVVAAP